MCICVHVCVYGEPSASDQLSRHSHMHLCRVVITLFGSFNSFLHFFFIFVLFISAECLFVDLFVQQMHLTPHPARYDQHSPMMAQKCRTKSRIYDNKMCFAFSVQFSGHSTACVDVKWRLAGREWKCSVCQRCEALEYGSDARQCSAATQK